MRKIIEIGEAKDIAQKEFPEYPISSITDIGDKWVFAYDTGNPPIPGSPLVVVVKSSGLVEYMSIPPLENLKLIESGIEIEI